MENILCYLYNQLGLPATVWYDEVYLPTYRKRLAQKYRWSCARLEEMGVRVRRASAGLFIWFNVKNFLRVPTMEEESGESGRLFLCEIVYL